MGTSAHCFGLNVVATVLPLHVSAKSACLKRDRLSHRLARATLGHGAFAETPRRPLAASPQRAKSNYNPGCPNEVLFFVELSALISAVDHLHCAATGVVGGEAVMHPPPRAIRHPSGDARTQDVPSPHQTDQRRSARIEGSVESRTRILNGIVSTIGVTTIACLLLSRVLRLRQAPIQTGITPPCRSK
jgi:hypothetical protein